MERVKNIAYQEHDAARSLFEDGLRRTFEINHDPLPETMARLLQALRDKERIGASH
jgi:hypothetical protein